MNNQDLWIDETMKTLDDIRCSTSSNLTEEAILSRWRCKPTPVSWFRSPLVWQAAAAVVVLLVLNFYTGFTTFNPVNGGPSPESVAASLDYLTPINF